MEGNQMKMREALIIVYDWILKAGNVHGYPDTEQKRRQLYDMMTKTLSAPPRNCDVGTAKEQANRMRKFCSKQKRDGIINCGYCPIKHEYQRDCTLEWEQMPYKAEEGDAK